MNKGKNIIVYTTFNQWQLPTFHATQTRC